MGKHFTDVEHIDVVKKWRLSGIPVKTLADQNGLNRETFREWANAYRDLEGVIHQNIWPSILQII